MCFSTIISGKTFENVRKRCNAELVMKRKAAERIISRPTFKRVIIINDELVLIEKHKTSVTLNKPISAGITSYNNKSSLFIIIYEKLHVNSDI